MPSTVTSLENYALFAWPAFSCVEFMHRCLWYQAWYAH